MGYYKAKLAKTFSLAGDVSKAHRRFRVAQRDWRFQACRLPKGAGIEAWVNKVGTVGHSTASYWYSRLQGAVGRLAISLVLNHWVFQLVFADDLRWSAAGGSAVET